MLARVGFFFAKGEECYALLMGEISKGVARKIAHAACEFEKQRTGHAPKSVTVVLSEDTLVITMHGALSEAEKALANSAEGAAQVQEFHRRLFAIAAHTLQKEIKSITGVEVREATTEVGTAGESVISVFASGTAVQVYLLAGPVPTDTWTEILDDPAGNSHADQ